MHPCACSPSLAGRRIVGKELWLILILSSHQCSSLTSGLLPLDFLTEIMHSYLKSTRKMMIKHTQKEYWTSLIFWHSFSHSFVHSSMALQLFVGPWPLLQFHNHFYTDGRTPWTNDQPITRPLPTHRINAHTDIHVLSGIRTHDPSIQASKDSSCLRPCGHCDQPYIASLA
jgi:hypothetical protein